MRFSPHKLSLRLILSLGVVVIPIFLVAMAVYYEQSQHYILTESRQRLVAEIDRAQAQLEQSVDRIQRTSQLIGKTLRLTPFRDADLQQLSVWTLQKMAETQGVLIALEPEFSEHPGGFATYVHRASSGNGSEFSQLDLNRAQSPYWLLFSYLLARVSTEAFWTDPYYSPLSENRPVVTYVVPVHRSVQGEERFAGVVMFDFDLGFLQRSLGQPPLSDEETLMVISDSAHVLSHPNSQWVMQYLPRRLQHLGLQNWRPMLAAVVEGRLNAKTFPCWNQREECLWGSRLIPATGWVLVGTIPMNRFFAPQREFALKFAGWGSALLIFTGALVTLLTRALTRPLANLVTVANRIGAGDFEADLPALKRPDEIGRLIMAFRRMQERLRDYVTELQQESSLRGRLEGEMHAAADIQRAMLPQFGHANVEGPGYHLMARLESAKSVGGDLFFYRELPQNQLFLAIGDVSDKGVPAALFMARIMTGLHRLAELQRPLEQILVELNNLLYVGNDNCMFVTMLLARLDCRNGHLVYCNAGHSAPLLATENHVLSLQEGAGPALGLLENVSYESVEVVMSPQSCLLIYTDGIDEAFDSQGAMYGHERVIELLRQSRAGELEGEFLVDRMLADVQAFSAGSELTDDRALMSVVWKADVTGPELLIEPPKGGLRMRELLPAQLRSCEHLFALLRNQARHFGLADSVLHDLLLIAEEVFVNIVLHAGISESNDSIQVDLVAGHWGMVLQFTDGGSAFDPLRDAPAAKLGHDSKDAPIGGLGVHLVADLATASRYRRVDRENRFCVSRLQRPDESGTTAENDP